MNIINDATDRIIEYTKNNHIRPLTVKYNGINMPLTTFLSLQPLVEAKKRLDNFLKANNRYPNTLKIEEKNYNLEDYKILYNMSVVNNNINHDDVFDYFTTKFGIVNTIDEVLSKINNKGYGHYYNNRLSNKQVIDELKKGNASVNCTDVAQMLYHCAKALGYEVKNLHIQCKGGDGHIRQDFKHQKHTGGNWIHRDGACVISNNRKPINSIWCGDGTIKAVNPNWFIQTINY